MVKVHTFVAVLQRENRDQNWGLRLVGGSDLDTPLIITRVNLGSPAQRELIRGDIITKIGDYDARDLRHEDAQNLFRNAGNNIKLVVQRGISYRNCYKGSFVGRSKTPTFRQKLMPDSSRAPSALSNGSTRPGSVIHSPMSPPYIPVPNSSYRSPSPIPSGPGSYRASLATPLDFQPHTSFPHYEGQYISIPDMRGSSGLLSPNSIRSEDLSDESIVNQPYRTTPLVLPGAKVKKDTAPTESYLRHHPNPAMRAPPHHDYHDVLMKQKVADTVLQRVVGEDAGNKVVHKQFNSPIGLYSEHNIADSIKQQTGAVPVNGYYGRPQITKSYKKTMLYDPAKSETFKMLQEDSLGDTVQEVTVPVQPKVFQAPTNRPHKKPVPPPPKKQTVQNQNQSYVNTLSDETIQQSNSFKRLMYNVLGESEF